MEKNSLKVSDIGEKQLIKEIIKKSNSINSKNTNNYKFPNYIGDDAALINLSNLDNKYNKDFYLVASSDMLIENTHFPKEMSFFQIGFKSVTVNISDVLAMGGEGIGFLFNIAIPEDFLLSEFYEIIDGVLEACLFYNCPLIGGDTNKGSEIIISGTAIGKVEKGKELMKYGFNKGDLVCITAEVGIAPLGFEILSNKNKDLIYEYIQNKKFETDDFIKLATNKALKPIVNINKALILKDIGVSSCTDITDGLASELYELFNRDKEFMKSINIKSPKGIRIYKEKIPYSEDLIEISKILNKDPLDLLLHTGEDFEFLFTISPEKINDLKKLTDFFIIGEITSSNRVEIVDYNKNLEKLSSKGYEHLSNN